jgi:hypothetical protein
MYSKAAAQKFLREAAPAAMAACAACGAPVHAAKLCLAQALLLSGGGKYVHWHNPWGLSGDGDAGYVWRAHLVADTSTAGSVRLVKTKLAKFSGWPAACAAWFRAQKKPS